MRKIYEADQQMWDDYNAAKAAYDTRLSDYNALSAWKKLTNRKPRWNAIRPGEYIVNVWRYFDKVESDEPAGDIGTWAAYHYEQYDMGDYSPSWYSRQDAQREQEMRRQHQAHADDMDSVWRANVGAAYYDLNQPWAWQRKPSGPFG